MELNKESIEKLREMIESGPKKILVLAHTNPDGDAIGSSIAWASILRTRGHEVTCMVPNRFPSFLKWMKGSSELVIFKENQSEETIRTIREAELIFCLDFNTLSRLERLGDVVLKENKTAKYILIDHHLNPPENEFDLMFSVTDNCSTSFLCYNIIVELYGKEVITKDMAEALYVGIITDTGNFSYSFLTGDLFRAVAVMVEKGIDIPKVHGEVYNSFTEGRVRLLGHSLNKMETFQINSGRVAYITLKEEEMRKFDFQQGDSEGFVNYPLMIEGLLLSAIFIETRKFIRVSLRSRGDVDVSTFAAMYFEGGGHRNASGGKSYQNIEQTVKHFIESINDYFSKYPDGNAGELSHGILDEYE